VLGDVKFKPTSVFDWGNPDAVIVSADKDNV